MNKTELVAAIAEKAEISKKDAEAALKAFTETVEQEPCEGRENPACRFRNVRDFRETCTRGQKPENR